MTEPAVPFKIKLLALAGLGAVLGWPADAAAQRLEPLRDPYRLEPAAPQRSEPEPERMPELDLAAFEETAPGSTAATIHLASYYSTDHAMRGWDILQARYPDQLAGREPILREIDLGARGRFVRLLAGPFGSLSQAEVLCSDLRGDGAYCVPADAAGEVLHPPQGFGG